MRSLRIYRTHTACAIYNQFPYSVKLAWNGEPISFVHYLVRGEEVFCCIKDQWWQIDYTWKTFNRGEEGYEECPMLDCARKVDPPEGVVYSYTMVDRCEDYVPMELIFVEGLHAALSAFNSNSYLIA
ncbi:hypothetical protein A3H16_00075 [Candidatus Kaiserbacteria bacterium RIFCSPLOWO2_12_FULL_53_8]|uniref:Uncharacterized protein n=2 Tax=Candidatus Kaiseribacteriota TaxID=1752734 RepID=A0A1F6CUK5_9BACT|nr:MAG: hypothetical protein A2851_01565 [Candidatus Kaiserbacteria bacterium RIFCSPHIGHO2_01_FULL_53_29]OGG92280.1 MAG: hypothetical protein A3H16_00075 [Candidatus Kaiserbacteria bacterium RIFCSPLOWO2_12_FULL_53_8]